VTAVNLAKPQDLDRLVALVGDYHRETGIDQDAATRRAALAPLLEGCPHGAAYLVGPGRAPIGYVIVAFGWSVRAGGLVGRIDEIYIRSGVRGRGIGAEVLSTLPRALAGGGVKELSLAAPAGDDRARRLYQRLRFRPLDDQVTMTRTL
jgi:ribosomal protein S18 acetylase RimI-like enzyme